MLELRRSPLIAAAILVVLAVSVGADVANTTPPPPGGCSPQEEGNVRIKEYCPDRKTWKVGDRCTAGTWVPVMQDCPFTTETYVEESTTVTPECAEFDEKDVVYCENDPSHMRSSMRCIDGQWHLVEQSCPTCIEGQVSKIIKPCPNDPTKWAVAMVCEGGHIREVSSRMCDVRQPSGKCEPGEVGECIEFCDDVNTFVVLAKDECVRAWVCSKEGSWEAKNVLEVSCCFIATATYGSGLSPEVQLLRNFRDRDVLQTFAGSNFMQVFNLVYYSFSPRVARVISANENLGAMMRLFLYPLIGILWATQQIYGVFALRPEGAVVIAGIFAGGLIGLIYASPLILAISFAVARAFRRRISRTHVRVSLLFLAIATILIIVSQLTRFVLLMQVSTSLLVLTSWALPGIALSAWILNRRQ